MGVALGEGRCCVRLQGQGGERGGKCVSLVLGFAVNRPISSGCIQWRLGWEGRWGGGGVLSLDARVVWAIV